MLISLVWVVVVTVHPQSSLEARQNAGAAGPNASSPKAKQEPKKGKNKGRGPALVAVADIKSKKRSMIQSFVGSLRPSRRSLIGSAVDGRIDSVFVDEGQTVGDVEMDQPNDEESPSAVQDENVLNKQSRIGQPLVQIKTRTLDLEIETAKVELKLRKQALEELELSIPNEIELAEALAAQAAAQKEYAEKLNSRLQNLSVGGGVSQKEREESRSQVRIQNQAFVAANADLQKLKSTRNIRLLIAQNRVKAQEAELARLADMRTKYTLRAPFPGSVTRKLIEKGDWITRGAPAIEIIQLNPIELRINVSQRYLAPLQASFDAATDEAPFTAEVRIDNIDTPFTGTVVNIVPEADQRTRSVPVVIRIQNPKTKNGYLLTSGLLARANLSIGQEQPALMVSKDALVLGEKEIHIFVVDRSDASSADERTVRKVKVMTGGSEGKMIEITGDVREGEQVVIQGHERLRPGQSIKIIE